MEHDRDQEFVPEPVQAQVMAPDLAQILEQGPDPDLDLELEPDQDWPWSKVRDQEP